MKFFDLIANFQSYHLIKGVENIFCGRLKKITEERLAIKIKTTFGILGKTGMDGSFERAQHGGQKDLTQFSQQLLQIQTEKITQRDAVQGAKRFTVDVRGQRS